EAAGKDRAWSPKATSAGIGLEDPTVPFDFGDLGQMAQRKQPWVHSGTALRREEYGHLRTRQTVTSIAVLPLKVKEELLGAIEVVSFKEPISPALLTTLAQVAEYASIGFASAIDYENERNTQMEAIDRLTQLYDFEKVVNSLLDLD